MPLHAAFFITFIQTLFHTMIRLSTFCIGLVISLSAMGQVSEMKWELDYDLYLKLANDSNFKYDVRDAFHVTDTKQDFSSDYVFYPVNPGADYINNVGATPDNSSYFTLWSALNAKIGGGWIHFTNCIAYALETGKLDLQSPLMKRPDSKWKPKPMTESFKRTKHWDFYVPVSQTNAIKEYKARKAEGAVNDINSLPAEYIDLFLHTSQKEYDELRRSGDKKTVAQIDLIKVLLGSNYLGEAQITYISNMVLSAVRSYSTNMLPTVVIFDEFDAAAVMSLDADGYNLEKVVFRSESDLRQDVIQARRDQIETIVDEINDYNQNSFKKRLGSYYKN